jgi:ABC-type anion transport system duplicated permease subunit
VIFALIFILNMFGLTNYISIVSIIKYNVVLIGFLIVALLFSLIIYILSEILVLLIK